MHYVIDRPLAQQIVDTVKSVCGQDINFIDESGVILASTNPKRIGTFHEIGQRAAQTGMTMEVTADDSATGIRRGINLPVYHNHILLAVIGISGDPALVRKYAYLAQHITVLLVRERELEAFSRSQSEKKLFVIDSLLRGDISHSDALRALLQEFHIRIHTEKRMVLIQLAPQVPAGQLPQLTAAIEGTLNACGVTLYGFHYPFTYQAVLDAAQFAQTAAALQRFAEKQAGAVQIAVGQSCTLYKLPLSYKTARLAMHSIAGAGKSYVLFDDLTLELVLSSLDAAARQNFLDKTIRTLSEKEKRLLRTYFQAQCSLSRTCQALYLHKNTAQYQLNRIETVSGLNPRRFQDAVLLYLALQMETLFPDAAPAQGPTPAV